MEEKESESTYVPNEFDESVKVELAGGKVARSHARYEKLPTNTKKGLLQSFRTFKNSVLTAEEQTQGQIQAKSEGLVGETPFLCFAEVDDLGNVASTIVITDKSASRTSKDEFEEYSYQEIRQARNGMEAVVNNSGTSLFIEGASLTQEKIRQMQMFTENAKLDIMADPNGLDAQSFQAYRQTLKSLGVDINVDTEDKGNYHTIGSNFMEKGIQSGMIAVYDKTKGYEAPESVSISTGTDKESSARVFRKTANGQYIDCESFQMVNGIPQYNLLTYEQIKEEARSQTIDVDAIERFEEFKQEDKETVPEAAVGINRDMERQQEREAQREQEEAEMDPNDPYARHADHGEL